MGGMSLAGTKSVNDTVRADGWCVVGWHQECKRYDEV